MSWTDVPFKKIQHYFVGGVSLCRRHVHLTEPIPSDKKKCRVCEEYVNKGSRLLQPGRASSVLKSKV